MPLSTKDKILEEAMLLFAKFGYKSVTVRAIAAKVGIRDSGLYKHFKSKQEIFNAIVETAKQRFLSRSEVSGIRDIRISTIYDSCISMFKFQTQDPWAVGLRQILLSEMFHDENMAKIYKNIFVDLPIKGEAYFFTELMKNGYMKVSDPIVAAMEIYSPFFLYHSVSSEDEDLENRYKQHVQNFIEFYFPDNLIKMEPNSKE